MLYKEVCTVNVERTPQNVSIFRKICKHPQVAKTGLIQSKDKNIQTVGLVDSLM